MNEKTKFLTTSVAVDNVTIYKTHSGRPEIQGASLVREYKDRLEPASLDQATGVNFAVYAPQASRVELCLFDERGREACLPMQSSSLGVWHLYVESLSVGQCYGFRADGQWQPNLSPRFNHKKLLLDPYSREIKGTVKWHPDLFDYTVSESTGAWEVSETDSAAVMPRSVVRETDFDWQGVVKPDISSEDSVIYELHVKGFSIQNNAIPEALRGTFLGLSHPASIDYLKTLGVTTVELLPVTSRLSEERLDDMGLSNYWGYNPLCLMAPEASLAINDPVTEMKTMVRELHRAGLEVILDVVFNHTCESGHGGPSLSLRGLGERDYYLMDESVDIRGHKQLSSANYTGCGNTMNFDCSQTLKLTMDALRCWVEEYHVDGFRFDLAPIMARQGREFRKDSAFFQAIYQDPVLSQCKMIAEPWDIGPDGYRLAGFPREWQEWNDRYRDGVRSFWRGDLNRVADIGWRLTGSTDVFGGCRPMASINYICSHDGFTLHDLVSYNERHNLANGEDNRDGDSHNYSWNHGVEGSSVNTLVLSRRQQAKRNMLATLMLSRGIPMLMAGDEFGNSQGGNNNAYCQDSELSWLDWSWQCDETPCLSSDLSKELRQFTADLIALRKSYPFLTGGGGRANIQWLDRHGSVLNEYQLGQVKGGCLCLKITNSASVESGCYEPLALYVLMNNEKADRRFDFSDSHSYSFWFDLLDTSRSDSVQQNVLLTQGWHCVKGQSMVVIEERLGVGG
ncbi:glycogen debranching enzyme GlgX [Endozoicomonas sp. (ex Bugula neritina AB1)]|nr:glycogen debranching enzyme GlgX [Endozoicomonas sp. (ex Bugula neritina AB1)]